MKQSTSESFPLISTDSTTFLKAFSICYGHSINRVMSIRGRKVGKVHTGGGC